jgi:hypothetical protein
MKATDIVKTPLTQCTRLTTPLKLKNEKYYWVLQEAICLQVDAAGNLVSHLNIYTILNEMDGNEDVIITGQLYNDGLEVKECTQKSFHPPILLFTERTTTHSGGIT